MKTCKDNNGRYQEMINAVLDEDKKKIGFVGNIDGMDVLKGFSKEITGKIWLYDCTSVCDSSTGQTGELQNASGSTGN